MYSLKITKAKDPAQYKWENLNASLPSKFEKKIYSFFIGLLIIIPCLIMIYYSHS